MSEQNENENENENKEPFDCLFENRRIFGKSLIEFIKNSESNDKVISIDADWGYGKTTFMNELQKGLKEEEFTVFTYNSWENDFESDPLKSFVQELIPQMMEASDYSERPGLVKAIFGIAGLANEIVRVGSKVIPLFTKVKIPEIDILKSAKNIKDNIKYLEEINPEDIDIQCYKEVSFYKSLKKKFIERLDIVQKEISPNKKVIILIDELDRCRPNFAIELLEIVKHLFNTDNYMFIFTISSKQLKESVKQIYGNAYDEKGYFRRFFDYEFYLPEPNKEEYFKSYFIKHELFRYVYKYIEPYNFSLRDYDKIIQFIKLVVKIYKVHKIDEILYLSFFISIKFLDPNLFTYLLNKKSENYNEIDKFDDTLKKISGCFNFYKKERNSDFIPCTIKDWIIAFKNAQISDLGNQAMNGASNFLDYLYCTKKDDIKNYCSFKISEFQHNKKVYYLFNYLNGDYLNNILLFGDNSLSH